MPPTAEFTTLVMPMVTELEAAGDQYADVPLEVRTSPGVPGELFTTRATVPMSTAVLLAIIDIYLPIAIQYTVLAVALAVRTLI